MENEKIIETVTRLETKVEQHDKEIEELKDTTKVLYEMNTNIKILAMQGTTQTEKIDSIESKVGKLDTKVEKMDITIEEIKCIPDKKDAEKWKGLTKQVFTLLVGAVIAIVFTKIGLL